MATAHLLPGKIWTKKRQGVPANEEQTRVNGRENQASSSCSRGQNPRYGAAGIGEQALKHQEGWKAEDQHRSPVEMNTLTPSTTAQGQPESLAQVPAGVSYDSMGTTKLQGVPSYVGKWSTEPMGRHLQSWFRSVWRRKTKEAGSAACSLQLPWEVQERTQSGSSCSYTLKAQEMSAAPRKGLCFSSFPQEKNLMLFYNFLENAVISENMQNKTMKVFYSLKHEIKILTPLIWKTGHEIVKKEHTSLATLGFIYKVFSVLHLAMSWQEGFCVS